MILGIAKEKGLTIVDAIFEAIILLSVIKLMITTAASTMKHPKIS
ncbi:MAG TPA: hypothetical protein VIK44_06565 [Acetobacterium sp.]